jgi:hypothetical protein
MNLGRMPQSSLPPSLIPGAKLSENQNGGMFVAPLLNKGPMTLNSQPDLPNSNQPYFMGQQSDPYRNQALAFGQKKGGLPSASMTQLHLSEIQGKQPMPSVHEMHQRKQINEQEQLPQQIPLTRTAASS